MAQTNHDEKNYLCKFCLQSTTVLSNLFPEQVKEELINRTAIGHPKDAKDAWKTSTTNNGKSEIVGARLARKYPKVTIMFADIAGTCED